MKLKKIFAGMAASAIAVTAFAMSASAATSYIGGIQGYKGSTEIDGSTGEAYADADAGANYFYGKDDNNPSTITFSTADVDFENGGTYTITTYANDENGFNKTNSMTVLGVYIQMTEDEMAAYGIENGQKNVAGGVSEDEGDVDEQIPYDVSIDSISFDGNEISGDWNSNYGAYIMGNEFKIELVNIWNGDISDNAFMDEAGKTTTALGAPVDEVSITFTITPKNAASTDSSSSSESTDSSSSSASTDDSTGSSSSSSSSTSSSSTSTSTTSTTTTTTTSSTSSTASDNTNAGTGATAGIALAGLAVAGAALVVSKRK